MRDRAGEWDGGMEGVCVVVLRGFSCACGPSAVLGMDG